MYFFILNIRAISSAATEYANNVGTEINFGEPLMQSAFAKLAPIRKPVNEPGPEDIATASIEDKSISKSFSARRVISASNLS